MNHKKKAWEAVLYSAVGVIAMLIVVLAVNAIASAAKKRIDFTQENLYTLSKGTHAILKKLDTPVKIRFYYTQSESEMPVPFKTYARRVEDLLGEYKQIGKGKIVIEKYDPKPDSEAEDSANLDGVTGQMINMGEKIYLGLAVSCLDAKVAIPFLAPDREKLLEYDLTRAIASVINPTKPVIGVMTPLPVFGMPMNPMMMRMGQQQGGQEPWLFINELKADFTVQQVEMSADSIPAEIKVLVVVFPKDISDKAQYALDQFVLRGGKLIAFLDPHSVIDNRNAGANPMQRLTAAGASLDRLLQAWGVQFDATKVAADLTFATRINRGAGRPEVAPGVLSLTQEGVNTSDVLTSQIDNLLVAFAGVFSGTPAAGLTETVLLKTSPNSQLIEKFMAEASSDQITKNFVSSGKAQPLAIRLTGKFKTAFPEGKPQDKAVKEEGEKLADKEKAEPASANSLKESSGENVVVLVGDADLLYDPFCADVQNFFGQKVVTPRNGNLGFLQGVVEQAAGDINLIAVRSRSTMNRPFTVMKKMQAQAEESYRGKIKELEDKLQAAQTRLNELQQKKEGNQRFILSPEQQAEIKKFTQEQAQFRKDLKGVRKALRQRIDSMENRIKWTNIAAMPLLVALSGISLAVIKRKKTSAK